MLSWMRKKPVWTFNLINPSIHLSIHPSIRCPFIRLLGQLERVPYVDIWHLLSD